MLDKTREPVKALATCEIVSTSESGDKLSLKDNVEFMQGHATRNVIHVYPEHGRQTVHGIGVSFTEASAFVLAHLDTDARGKVMQDIFGESGANFSMARTVIGACDFSVDGRWSYDDVKGDTGLSHFSVTKDFDGFSTEQYPHIRDPHFDLLPMIKQALAIKNEQADSVLKIIASAWTAPGWMKDIDDWYLPGNEQNGYAGTGGSLKVGYERYYADYLIRYIESYRMHGIDIWALTPVNEPLGNNGQWESMHFTPHSQNEFIKEHLGPALNDKGLGDIRILMYDHNRDGLQEWADVLYNDAETASYLYGAAVHWYESSHKVSEDVLKQVHDAYPEFEIIHTEGCIDDLGKEAPPGVLDPERFKESGWFGNDSFWWNDNATDWAYSVTWDGVDAEDHPIYTPVHRYARNIIVSLNNWLSGWVDWNIVLDRQGGPNHVGNYCGAPIMIDTESEEVYYTPIYYILSQFSRTIRPGDRVVRISKMFGQYHDDIYSCATINDENLLTVQVLNTARQEVPFYLQIKDQCANMKIDANCLQTIRIQL